MKFPAGVLTLCLCSPGVSGKAMEKPPALGVNVFQPSGAPVPAIVKDTPTSRRVSMKTSVGDGERRGASPTCTRYQPRALTLRRARLAPQHVHEPHELIVGVEAEDDLPAIRALEPDLDAGGIALPQLVFQADYVSGLLERRRFTVW